MALVRIQIFSDIFMIIGVVYVGMMIPVLLLRDPVTRTRTRPRLRPRLG